MHWSYTKRWLRMLTAGSLLLAAACGGGRSPVEPGSGNDGGGNGGGGNGGGGNGGGGNGLAGEYQLARIGFVGLPADLTFDGCDAVRITGGALELNHDGTWAFSLDTQYATGAERFDDEGTYVQTGAELVFDSEAYGDSFGGKIDGGIKMDYDWCPDGQSDIQLVFGR
ncbi:MAG: hypothetical protein ACREOQ_00100 [Gemmatimonadales bacterium]